MSRLLHLAIIFSHNFIVMSMQEQGWRASSPITSPMPGQASGSITTIVADDLLGPVAGGALEARASGV